MAGKGKRKGGLADSPEVILDEGREVSLAGQKAMLRRFDVRAVFRFSKILLRVLIASPSLRTQAVTKDEDGTEKINTELILWTVLTTAEDAAMEFLGFCFGMEKEAFAALPGEAVLDAVEALKDQPDLKVFLSRAWNMAKSMLPKPKPAPPQSVKPKP